MLDDTISGFVQIMNGALDKQSEGSFYMKGKTGYRLNSDSIGDNSNSSRYWLKSIIRLSRGNNVTHSHRSS